MKISGYRPGLELGTLAQHRPWHVAPPARQRYESLRVPFALLLS
jgi:hypothetical protein